MRLIKLLLCVIVGSAMFIVATPTSYAARINCSRSEAQLIREKPNDTLEFQGTIYYSGSLEGKNHYDALVVAYRDNDLRWCRRYETDDDTSTHAEQLNEWGGRIFVTITTDSATGQMESYAQGGWLSSYGWGAGPVVALVAEIDPTKDGEVLHGTYILSKTEDGLTNTTIIYGVQFYDMRVHIDGIASSYVLNAQGNPLNYIDCPRGSAFRYVLDYDMTQLLEVECNGITERSNAVLRNNGELPEDLPQSINPGGGFFSYCTNSAGIVVMDTNEDGVGYELFFVTNAQIGNGIEQASASGEPVKLGEHDDIRLWALDEDQLQFTTDAPYEFIFSKYLCGDPVPDGAPITVSTSENLPADLVREAPVIIRATPTPAPGAGLPVYRPSPLKLNDDGTYTIRAGDNLNTIAAKLGINVDVLADYNGITDKRLVYVGQIIQIPDEND